jgi:hypothetical protein
VIGGRSAKITSQRSLPARVHGEGGVVKSGNDGMVKLGKDVMTGVVSGSLRVQVSRLSEQDGHRHSDRGDV